MKTLFLTVSRGILVRNLLVTGIVGMLVDAGVRVVILTPAVNDPEFRAAFASERVLLAPLHKPSWTLVDRVLTGLHRGLVWNATSSLVARYGVYSNAEGSFDKWLFYGALFGLLSRVPGLKRVARAIDAAVRPDRAYATLFDAYKPDLVFSTNIMEDADSLVIKAARSRGVPTVGMPKSWDNLSKSNFPSAPDRLIVWSPYMADEAKVFQGYPPSAVTVTGIPQFDLYRTRVGVPDRETFFREIGADPTKRLVVFTSEAKLSPPDPAFVKILAEAIGDGRIPEAQLLVRPHFGFRNDLARFVPFHGTPGVIVDTDVHPRSVFYDEFDYSIEHWRRLAATLFHADVVVTTFSTMTLDATACGKPVVNAVFDGEEKKQFGESILRWYASEHYRQVMETGAPIVARDAEELVARVNDAFRDPAGIHAEGRAQLLARFIGPFDGKSSVRVADAILDMLGLSASGSVKAN